MQFKKVINMIEAHAEGEVGRVITGGVVTVPGKTMLDKLTYLNTVDDSIRRFCVHEPRGYAQMSSNLLLPSTREDCDIGFIVLQGDKAHAMSGSNCICVSTVLLETGMIEMRAPKTTIRFDMPSGVVVATADCAEGKCNSVTLNMPPSFVHELDMTYSSQTFGRVKVDIAFGGIFYALLDAKQFNLKITPENAKQLVNIGTQIHRELNQIISVSHPEQPELNGIAYTMFIDEQDDGELIGATILPPGRIDRSPCGTGNSARLAMMYEKGQIQVGESYIARSIIGSRFDIKFLGRSKLSGKSAVLPQVTGRGWIYGTHQIGIDPSDPFTGHMVSDCWGDAFDLVD